MANYMICDKNIKVTFFVFCFQKLTEHSDLFQCEIETLTISKSKILQETNSNLSHLNLDTGFNKQTTKGELCHLLMSTNS